MSNTLSAGYGMRTLRDEELYVVNGGVMERRVHPPARGAAAMDQSAADLDLRRRL